MWSELDGEALLGDVIGVVLGEGIPGRAEVAHPEFVSVVYLDVGVDDRATAAKECRVLNNHEVLDVL